MSLPKIDEVTPLSDEEISEQILAIKKELFELRLQRATGEFDKPHLFKHKRHRLGQLLTVERQRQIASAKASAEATAEASPEATAEDATPSTPEPVSAEPAAEPAETAEAAASE